MVTDTRKVSKLQLSHKLRQCHISKIINEIYPLFFSSFSSPPSSSPSSSRFRFVSTTDSQKLDSCNEGGLNLISKNNNNNSNNNRNRTTSSNYTINNNELPADDIDPTTIKSERIARSSSRSHCDTEHEKLADEQDKSDDSQESATENEGDNNNNEDDERAEGELCGEDPSKSSEAIEKSKHYKKKKRRRRKRELTLKSDQSQQIEDDEDDEMSAIKDGPLGDNDNDGNLSDSYINDHLVKKHSVSITRRRHSSSSDPVNLSIGSKHHHHHQQDDSDDANIDVETISNAPTKVSSRHQLPIVMCC